MRSGAAGARIGRAAAAQQPAAQRQQRSLGLQNKKTDLGNHGLLNWRHPRSQGVEKMAAYSEAADEKTQELFGVDHLPWVHVVKDPVTTGRGDPEHHLLWERPVYSQWPDPRNDWVHRWRQGTVEKLPKAEQFMKSFKPGQAHKHYLGCYPDSSANNPGDFWKSFLSKQLHSGMEWERSKERALTRYGGVFALPGDDYNTLQGVLPLLSPMGWRQIKYCIHEPIVRQLNAALPETLRTNPANDLENVISSFGGSNPEVESLACRHEAFCVFYKSVRPQGNVLRPELAAEIASAFGSVDGFKAEFIKAGEALEGDGFAWLALDHSSNSLKVVALSCGVSPRQSGGGLVPLLCCPLHEGCWGTDWDGRGEFLRAFFGVVDWEFLLQALAHARGQPAPEPLVF
eukprot:TRINITY_DN959_c8_g1_i1.p1 TRINITY_DN959_c8_g1~~TRINITY_DN959_c8_g1_i1.p1  ORF type:complete len:438 (+),score=169.60 TRINITY_DN959_c8_g1_i1:116-1315(+)